MMMSLTTLCL